jgi:hypothetical protein
MMHGNDGVLGAGWRNALLRLDHTLLGQCIRAGINVFNLYWCFEERYA